MDKKDCKNKYNIDIKKYIEEIVWYKKHMKPESFFKLLKKNTNYIENLLYQYFNEKISIKEIQQKYEIFAIVDKNDNIVIDSYDWNPIVRFRKDCHIGKNKNLFIHRSSDFLIVNTKWEILLSQRSKDKDTFPWYYEIWWWHCWIDDYKTTLYKELKEELGIFSEDILKIVNMWKYLYEDKKQNQITTLFVVYIDWDKKIKFNTDEIVKNNRYSEVEILDIIKYNKLNIMPSHKYSLLLYMNIFSKKDTNLLIKEVVAEMKKMHISLEKI